MVNHREWLFLVKQQKGGVSFRSICSCVTCSVVSFLHFSFLFVFLFVFSFPLKIYFSKEEIISLSKEKVRKRVHINCCAFEKKLRVEVGPFLFVYYYFFFQIFTGLFSCFVKLFFLFRFSFINDHQISLTLNSRSKIKFLKKKRSRRAAHKPT